jgi:hypothetical protein
MVPNFVMKYSASHMPGPFAAYWVGKNKNAKYNIPSLSYINFIFCNLWKMRCSLTKLGLCTLAMFVCDNACKIMTPYHLPYLPWQ